MLDEALKVAKQIAGLRLSHEAVMLDDAQQLLKQNRAATASHVQSMTGASAAEGSDGVIHIGDTIHVAQPAATSKPASTLAKLGLAAALMVGGGGIGAAIPLAIDALRTKESIIDTDTDTDTVFDIVIPGGSFPPNTAP